MAKPVQRRRSAKSADQVSGVDKTPAGARAPAETAIVRSAEHVKAIDLQRSPSAKAVRSAIPTSAATSAAAPATSAASSAGGAAKPSQSNPSASSPATRPSVSTAPAAAAQQKSGGGAMGHGIAAVIGGLVVLAGLGAYQLMAPNEVADSGQADTVASLEAQIAELRDSVAAMTEAAGNGEPVEDTALRDELTALGERIASIESAATDDISADTAAANTAALDELRAALASEQEARDSLSSEIASRLDAIEADVADTSAEERAALAFAAASLKSAIDRGGSFSAELDAFAGIAPDNQAAESLRPFADSGLPTRTALAEQFPDVARAMLVAINVGSEDAGVLDRLMSSALSVVTVRPTGNVEGGTPVARIARMEARISEGDLAAALTEWEALPEPAKAVSQDYIAQLRGRAEADEITDAALASASEAISAETN